jgi:phosphatidylglycerol---prolipoprotein diacylglyceryl transferase
MVLAIPFPDIAPELFSFEIGGFTIALRWYALAYIAGILIGWQIVKAAIRQDSVWAVGPPMSEEDADDLLTWMVVGIILGGRLGFVLFYQPAYYLSNPGEILKVWQGGMSFHGGMLGVAIALAVFSRLRRVPLMGIADCLAIATPPGLMFGRIANFINAELWGRPTDLPWGVVFPGLAAQDCPGVEGLCARHPSQLYEAGLEGLVLGILLLWIAFARGGLKVPGQMTGLFLAGYGAARVVVEHFRQADAQFLSPDNPLGHVVRLGEAGLTMGQLLSLPMLVVGIIIVLVARYRAGRHRTA